LQSVPAVAVTVPAGGSATLEIKGFALQPGSTIAQGSYSLAQQPLASDRVRTSLYYGIDWGYTETGPQQVALAIWWAQDGAWLSEERAVAERIANAAASAPGLPVWLADGRSIVSLVAQGQLAISEMRLSPSTSAPALAVGTLVLRNTTGQDIVAHLPYGTTFTGQAGSALVWAIGVGAAPPPQASATPEPPAATATTEPVPTTSYKPGYTPTEEPAPQATETTVAPDPAATQPAPEVPPAEPTQATEGAPPVAPSEKGAPPAETGSTEAPPATTGGTDRTAGKETSAPAPAQSDNAAADPVQAPQPIETASSATAGESAPQPLATPTTGGSETAPPPVSTAQAQPPNPELTQVVPIKEEPTPTFTPAGATTDQPVKEEPTKEVPVEQPTKEVPVEQLPPVVVPVPTPETKTEDPIINVAGGDASFGGTTGAQPPAGTGSPPGEIASTGGGPSALPAWLVLFSAIMVIGGWSLRRVAGSALQPVPIERKSEEQE
jgi:hypothetical protein